MRILHPVTQRNDWQPRTYIKRNFFRWFAQSGPALLNAKPLYLGMISTQNSSNDLDLRIDSLAAHVIDNALTYPEYRSMVTDLFENGKSTGGSESADILHYSMLNITRMKRLDKTTTLLPDVLDQLHALDRDQTWLVLTEGWCGDAAQIVPVLNKMAEASPRVELRFILRDENLDLMDEFLTDGGRSIPVVVILDSDSKAVLGRWGPRPAVIQEMVLAHKRESATITDPEERSRLASDMKVDVQRWYTKDKTASIQREFLERITSV